MFPDCSIKYLYLFIYIDFWCSAVFQISSFSLKMIYLSKMASFAIELFLLINVFQKENDLVFLTCVISVKVKSIFKFMK